MKKHATSVAAVALVFSWTFVGRADDMERYLDRPSVSPETSRGVEPRTTPGPNRSETGPSTPLNGSTVRTPSSDVRRYAFDPVDPTRLTSTTTTTSLLYEPMTMPDRSPLRPHRGLLLTGGVMFLSAYAAGVLHGGLSDTDGDKNLYIPVVGPWVALGMHDCLFTSCEMSEGFAIAHIVAVGVTQAVGLGLAAASLFVDEPRTSRPAPPPTAPKFAVQIAPISFGRFGSGLGAVGTFF
jgi:hypothetical protein